MPRNVQADVAIQQYAERCVQERRAAEVRGDAARLADRECWAVADADQLLQRRWEPS